MSNLIEIGKTGELEDGTMKEALVRDKAVERIFDLLRDWRS